MVVRLPNLSSSAATSYTTSPTAADPYRYQVGFANHHATEAVPGALPPTLNTPQKCPFDLYSEHLSGTSFISTRATVSNVWMYRIRPSVAHHPLKPKATKAELEACFSPLNPNITFNPLTMVWGPLAMPVDEEKVTFIEGLKTMGGHGDPTTKEGLAVHMYAANTSMANQAFCNNDGEFLIIPQKGRLDIQTELGRLMVRPGEICVIQAGLRFKVSLPDGPVHGYVQEIFGTHYELPDLGPIGANGLAHPRDFQSCVASFDLDNSNWEIVHKLAGKLFSYTQNHTPFDVVAWHGKYAPYKYALEKFVSLTSNMEQCDPSIYCVLLAKSKIPGVNLSEFCVFGPKWVVASNHFRPPYYHRTMATEMLGMVYGEYHGSVRDLGPGCLSCENSYMPHGESYESWKHTTTRELKPEFISKDTISFMMHMSSHFALTKFATERHPEIKAQKDDSFWDDLQGHFLDNIVQINKNLTDVGLPALEPEGMKSPTSQEWECVVKS